MPVAIEKIPGGLLVDGIRLMKGKCGCTALAKCCYSWTRVKKRGSKIEVSAKMTTPDTTDNFDWGYTVSRDGTTVTVSVEDARDKDTFSGFIPPPVEAWTEKDWKVESSEGRREDGTVWRCAMCKWLYKDDEEDAPFEDLPDDWVCPVCGAPKGDFERVG
jgi:rubredoxin